jgi:hypothetical protein
VYWPPGAKLDDVLRAAHQKAGLPYHGEWDPEVYPEKYGSPSGPQPEPVPLAPSHHRAYWTRSDWRERVLAASSDSFTPSAEWQPIPDGYPCPPGGEFRMNFQTGVNMGRWPTVGGGEE